MSEPNDDFFLEGYNNPWTADQKAEADRLLKGLDLSFDRRGQIRIIPGRMEFTGIGQNPVTVVIFGPENELKVVLSMAAFPVGEPVILYEGSNHKGVTGKIAWVRPGLRTEDPPTHWYSGFVQDRKVGSASSGD